MLQRLFSVLITVGAMTAAAQQPSQPQVKVNVLNVCSPSAEEKEAIDSALARIPKADKPEAGKKFNLVKRQLEDVLETRKIELSDGETGWVKARSVLIESP